MQCFASCTPITAMFFSDYFSLKKMCCLLFMSGRQDYCLHDYNIKYDVHNVCDKIDVPLNYLLSLIFIQQQKTKQNKIKQNSELQILAASYRPRSCRVLSTFTPVQQRPQGCGQSLLNSKGIIMCLY